MSGLEWRVVVTILLSPGPVSARWTAVRRRYPYGRVKRVIRGLVAWQILERTTSGLSFQPDQPMRAGGKVRRRRRSRCPAGAVGAGDRLHGYAEHPTFCT